MTISWYVSNIAVQSSVIVLGVADVRPRGDGARAVRCGVERTNKRDADAALDDRAADDVRIVHDARERVVTRRVRGGLHFDDVVAGAQEGARDQRVAVDRREPGAERQCDVVCGASLNQKSQLRSFLA